MVIQNHVSLCEILVNINYNLYHDYLKRYFLCGILVISYFLFDDVV